MYSLCRMRWTPSLAGVRRRWGCEIRVAELDPCRQPPGEHQTDHAEVADERPERTAERGWLVLLHQEVSGPREPISDAKEQQLIPWMPKNQRGHHDRNSERGTTGMQD